MKKGVAIGGLILVTAIWGGGFVASDMALESMKPFQIMMVRFLLASVLMGLVSMGQRKKEAKFRKVTRRQSVKYRDCSAERKSVILLKNVTILVPAVYPLPLVNWQMACVWS